MIRIQLPGGEWDYDENSSLGPPGGFGAVFVGKGKNRDPVAVKRLHPDVTDAAHRELRIADVLVERSLKHVIPVFDAGRDPKSNSFFVVMAIAEKSLQQEIERINAFTEKEAVDILHQIASGLMEVDEIVHRDMKPGNVLFHEGKWKVADFGIARFVEESTSLKTLKDCLSPPYAAPEQWRMERATSATDVYSLACVAYALLTGTPPFGGPEFADYREQHLSVEPATLNEVGPRLRGLVAMMLNKNPRSRPSLRRVITILDEIRSAGVRREGPGLQMLAEVAAAAAEDAARANATLEQHQVRERTRNDLAEGAFQNLHRVTDSLFARILNAAPIARRAGSWETQQRVWIEFGTASLQVSLLNSGRPIPEDSFSKSGWDVVAGATIHVLQQKPKPYRWGANLWYSNLGQGDSYRWWEIPYFSSGSIDRRRHSIYEPFALEGGKIRDADLAASNVVHAISMAARPLPIDGEDLDDFCDRWASLLAKAYKGKLRHPRHLPLS